MFLRFSCIFPFKNHSKTLPKRGPNPSKIDAENVLIFNIDFLRFWHRFGRVLGLQDGIKLAKKRQKSLKGFFFGCLKLNVFYKLRLGGLQAPFWRLQGSILEPLGLDFGRSGDDFLKFSKTFWHVASKTSLQYSLQQSLRRSLPCWSSRFA